jgi:hypothetical protein
VDRRAFTKLTEAEKFCIKNNLDVNKDILSEDPAVLETAKDICFTVLPVLSDLKESIQEEFNNQLIVYNKAVDEFKESETKCDLLRNYKEQQMYEALGKLRGIAKVLEIIEEQIQAHKEILTHV